MSKINNLLEKLVNAKGKKKLKILIDLARDHVFSDPAKSMKYAQDILLECQNLEGYSTEKGYAHYYIAMALNKKGLHSETIENYRQAMDYFHKGDDKEIYAGCAQNLSTVYFQIEKNEEALKLLNDCLEIFQELGSEHGEGVTRANLGLAHLNLENYDESMENYKRAINIFKNSGKEHYLGNIYMNMALLYHDINDYDNSESYNQRALKLFEMNDDMFSFSGVSINLGFLQTSMKKYDEAQQNFLKAISICEKEHFDEWLHRGYLGMAELKELLGDYKISIDYYKKKIKINDKLHNEATSKNIAEMQAKFETERKEKEAEIHRLRNVELADKNKLVEKQKKELAGLNNELNKLNEYLQEKNEELYHDVITDNLTRAFSRTYILDSLNKEFAKSTRHSIPLSVIIFDIDHFKALNDNYGHLAGDQVLREVSSCVKKQIREEDLFGRYGGEEFIVVLPGTGVVEAKQVAEKIRKFIKQNIFVYEEQDIRTSVSLGISGINPATEEASRLLRNADIALYEAKRAGRNLSVVFAGE